MLVVGFSITCELAVNSDALSFLPAISLLGSAFSFIHMNRFMLLICTDINLELVNIVGPSSTNNHWGFLAEHNITGKTTVKF